MKNTIKEFIKNFEQMPFMKTEEELPDLKTMSYEEKFAQAERAAYTTWGEILNVEEDHVWYARKGFILKRVGSKFFRKSVVTSSIYVSSKEVRMKDPSAILPSFLRMNKRTAWILDTDLFMHAGGISSSMALSVLSNASIFKSIICGTIYSEETLYKAIAKRIWKFAIPWRDVRRLFQAICMNKLFVPKISDLKDFTKSPDKSITEYLRANQHRRQMMEDMLYQAIKLNCQIDFTWSDKRMLEEHKNMTNALMQKELEKLDKTDIYENILSEHPTIKLLNTELEVFKEGRIMHHCVYSNYFRRMKEHRYMAFHMTAPEDVTVGIKMIEDKPVIDQIYQAYDAPASDDTWAYFKNYFCNHKDEIIQMFKQTPHQYPVGELSY